MASSAAGVGISADALFSRTARLPLVDFRKPPALIGKNTVESMQPGLYYGAIGAIDGIIERPDCRTWARYQDGFDGGPGRTHCRRIAFYSERGRKPDTGRVAPHLGSYAVSEASTKPWASYFNYFTEVEEHFQKARGTSLFLLSPLDWALIESWKNSGVPLEAVLRGIDVAFEKWRAKRSRVQMVNSLAFCAQPVMLEAQRMADTGAGGAAGKAREPESSPFASDELRKYLERNSAVIRATSVEDFEPVALSLDRLADELDELARDPEAVEQRLNMLEQKLIALARARQTDEQALAIRGQLDAQLGPYKSRMTAPQIAMLQAQFLEKALLETARLPRLSLFYLG